MAVLNTVKFVTLFYNS